MRRVVLLFPLIVVTPIACSSFGEDAVDAPSSSPPVLDASAGEAATTTDAGSVACSAGAIFCESFENGLGAWTSVDPETVVEDREGHGRVLVARLPEGKSPEVAFINHTLEGASAKLRLSFSFRLPTNLFPSGASGNQNFSLGGIRFTTANVFELNAYVSADGRDQAKVALTTYVGNATLATTGYATVSYGAWHRLVAELDIGPSGRAAFALDGVEVAKTAAFSSGVDTPVVRFGLYRPNDPTPALTSEIDDVVVENR